MDSTVMLQILSSSILPVFMWVIIKDKEFLPAVFMLSEQSDVYNFLGIGSIIYALIFMPICSDIHLKMKALPRKN